MLRDEIRPFVSMSGCKTLVSMSGYKTLEDMITKAQEWEIELELRTKRKPTIVQIEKGSTKKPKIFDSRATRQQG